MRLLPILALAALASCGMDPAFAQTPRPLPKVTLPIDPLGFNNKSGGTSAPASNGIDLLKIIDDKILPDLKAAAADAKATEDTIAEPCLTAWVGLIEAQNAAQAAPLPNPHIITDFQRMRDLVNALRPGSKIRVACAPLAEEMKMDVKDLLGKVAAGAIALPVMLAPVGL